ncbi:hypothetical protein AB0J35_41755 [Nonomuraea angiospora]|uniref:hypothetical protein n=1 Tax=Nonomuraea angiospora TaxID=46172 RepID=UPI00342027D1
MRFSILGALLGTVALAGAGGVAITQTSATDPLRSTDNRLGALGANVALTTVPTTSPAPTETPTIGEYTATTKVVKRRGVSYLNVSITDAQAALFSIKQRVCKGRSCKTTSVDLPVTEGSGESTERLGRGTYKKKGKPAVSLTPLPTVTVKEQVTVTEPGPTVTQTVTFTCQPSVEPTETLPPPTTVPTETPPPTADPSGTATVTATPTATGTESPPVTDAPAPTPTLTDSATETPTGTPTETPTTTPTETSTTSPTDSVTPTESAPGIPTCPPPAEETPTELPSDTPTDTATPTDTSVPTETATTTPSQSPSATTQ